MPLAGIGNVLLPWVPAGPICPIWPPLFFSRRCHGLGGSAAHLSFAAAARLVLPAFGPVPRTFSASLWAKESRDRTKQYSRTARTFRAYAAFARRPVRRFGRPITNLGKWTGRNAPLHVRWLQGVIVLFALSDRRVGASACPCRGYERPPRARDAFAAGPGHAPAPRSGAPASRTSGADCC